MKDEDMILMDGSPEFTNRMSSVVARAWSDPNFKQELLKNPKETLERVGLKVPNIEVVFLEDTDHRRHLVLPATPTMRDLSEDDLIRIAARKLEAQLTLF